MIIDDIFIFTRCMGTMLNIRALKLSNLENFMALKASNLARELWTFSITYEGGGGFSWGQIKVDYNIFALFVYNLQANFLKNL